MLTLLTDLSLSDSPLMQADINLIYKLIRQFKLRISLIAQCPTITDLFARNLSDTKKDKAWTSKIFNPG